MATRTYQNFDLLLETEEAGSFRARVTSCPLGESPSATFSLPFNPTQLENLMLKLDPGRTGTRRAAADPRTQASMDLGGPLFETVFADDIRLAWSRSQDVARGAGDGLRLRLRLTDAPAIAGLPWELLYDRRGNNYIAQSERTPVVRYLEVPQPPRPLTVDGALRILCVISSPTDLPELDVEAEWRRVQDALASRVEQGTVVVDRLESPTIEALAKWLQRNDVHILHFIGHGDYDEQIQDGVLYFTDRYGRGTKVSPTVLGPYLRDHDPLRLVLLNACQSARVDTTDPFSGMAQGLVQQDCTAVVAMQFPISDGAATTFTGEFYGSLADGLPVDQAATSARKALLAEYAAEWATPVLFLRAPDGQVFDHIVAQPSVPAPPTPTAAEPEPAPAPAPGGEPAVTTTVPVTFTQPIPQPTPEVVERQAAPPPPPSPRRRRRWGLIALVAAVAVVAVLATLYFIGSRLPDTVDAAVAGDNGAGNSVSTLTGPKISAVHLTTGLTINADGSDWPKNAPSFDSNVLVAGSDTGLLGHWTLAWDAKNFYYLVTVKDATALQTHAGDTSQLFKGDGVSFEFGTAQPKGANTQLEAGDKHVLVGPAKFTDSSVISGVNVADGKSFVKGSSTVQGLQAAVAKTSAGYLIEAAIPWSTLGAQNVTGGAEFGMNLNVSDAIASGSRAGELNAMVSNNPARKGNDAQFRSIWGTLRLAG